MILIHNPNFYEDKAIKYEAQCSFILPSIMRHSILLNIIHIKMLKERYNQSTLYGVDNMHA